MELDILAVKAISAEARRKMLKSLAGRKKMPSELSKEIRLAPSTVVKHLQNLENAGLIRRIETGHKWVYYELTDKGMGIIRPKMPVQFLLSFAFGVLMASFGFLRSMSSKQSVAVMDLSALPGNASNSSGIVNEPAVSAAQSLPFDWVSWLFFAIGLLFIALSVRQFLRIRQQALSVR